MVNVCPLDRRDSKEEEISSIAFQHRAREVLEEVVGGALVKLLGWVLHQPEDDGLWAGEHKGQNPGDQDHQPETLQVCKIQFAFTFVRLIATNVTFIRRCTQD